jgi:hypothetical protein
MTTDRSAVRWATAAVLLLLFGACATGSSDPADVEWGVDGAADEGGCDPAADLCWTSEDSSAMTAILAIEQDILLREGHGPTALESIVDFTERLAHKLTDQESTELDLARDRIEALPSDATDEACVAELGELRSAALRRLEATHMAAYMVPVGREAEHSLSGSSDDPAPAGATAATRDNPRYTAGMRESLELLRGNGAVGKAYAWMLETSGILERDYSVINASNFGTYDADHGIVIPLGLSREEQVDRILDHYQWAAAQIGVVAGTEALIPIAGVPISIAHETYALFRLHAQMAFEIAAVYGWDIREGRTLFTVSLMVMTVGVLAEVADVFASNAVLPILARRFAARAGVTLPLHELEKQLAQRSVNLLLRIFTRQSQERIASAALQQGARGVGRQVLGYATLGMAVFASGAIDYVETGFVGRHVETVAKRWFSDMMLDGTSYLSTPAPRDCMFRTLGVMAWADGEVSTREQNLYMAMLAKPYRVDERAWITLDSAERVRQSRALTSARETTATMGAIECLGNEFQRSMPRHRLTLAAHLYAMMNVDTHEHAEERGLYDRLVAEIAGEGWFDGSELDTDQLAFVERSVYLVVYPGRVEVGAEHREAASTILPEDVLPILGMPTAEVLRDFRCGFAEECD